MRKKTKIKFILQAFLMASTAIPPVEAIALMQTNDCFGLTRFDLA